MDEGVYQAEIDDALGAQVEDVILGEVGKVSFVFSGDDAGTGIGSVFVGVETG